MSYRLFRVPAPDADPIEGVCLGSFPTFDAALEVRDDDTVALLAVTGDGEQLVACHHIVAADACAEVQSCPVISAVERRVSTEDPTADLTETRSWLAEIHRRTH